MSTATENPFAGQGSVLLDIGGDVGALVVVMPAEMDGTEVEVRPAQSSHQHTHHPHVAVVNRPVVGGHVPSLVFPELDEGLYDLCVKGTEDVRLSVAVRGGEVVEQEWPA